MRLDHRDLAAVQVEREVPERGGGVRHREAKARPWLRGVVKMYNASRRFGFLLPMDGGKNVRFLSKCVEGGASVKVGSRVHFQDFVSGDRRNAHAVRVFSGTTAGEGVV